MDTLSEGKDDVAAAIEKHRNDTKEKKKQLAQLQREKMLKSMGFVVASPEQGGKIKASSTLTGLEDLEDEGGFVCVVCREGYKFKPKESLGIYTFSKRIEVSLGGSPTKPEKCYSTVTHFNLIHNKCHSQATRSDRSGKHTREEWEGATLRNSDTKCNNLFPIMGPETTDSDYHDNLEYYFTRLNEIWATPSPRFRMLAHDIRSLYLKFSFEESFSVDTHGGGRESNVKLIPFMVQLGHNLLTQSPSGVYEASLTAFFSEKEDKFYPAQLDPDDACFLLVISLFLRTPQHWEQIKASVFTRLLLLARRKHQGKDFDLTAFFKTAKPLMIFYFLIRETFKIFGSSTTAAAPKIEEGGGGGAPSDPKAAPQVAAEPPASDPKGKGKVDDSYFVNLQRELKVNVQQMLPKFMKMLSTYEEDLLPLETFGEFFDVLGLLDIALANHKTCEEYLTETLAKYVK